VIGGSVLGSFLSVYDCRRQFVWLTCGGLVFGEFVGYVVDGYGRVGFAGSFGGVVDFGGVGERRECVCVDWLWQEFLVELLGLDLLKLSEVGAVAGFSA